MSEHGPAQSARRDATLAAEEAQLRTEALERRICELESGKAWLEEAWRMATKHADRYKQAIELLEARNQTLILQIRKLERQLARPPGPGTCRADGA